MGGWVGGCTRVLLPFIISRSRPRSFLALFSILSSLSLSLSPVVLDLVCRYPRFHQLVPVVLRISPRAAGMDREGQPRAAGES
jgi:hypothetical protein